MMLAGAMVLAGFGCGKEYTQNPKDYHRLEGAFVQPYSNGGRDTFLIYDIDGDKLADVICKQGGRDAVYVAPDFSGQKYCHKGPLTRIMTPGEITAASRSMVADQELALLFSQRK